MPAADLSTAGGDSRGAVAIRPARSTDGPDMARVEQAARAQLLGVGIDLDQLDGGGFDEDTSWHLAVVAEAGGTIVGMVRATIDQDRVIIDQVSVDPAWGRQGIGTALLETLAIEARHIGLESMVGTTFRDVAFNAPFYQRLGARLVDEQELGQRRRVERHLGLDKWGDRVVVSFDLSDLHTVASPPVAPGTPSESRECRLDASPSSDGGTPGR